MQSWNKWRILVTKLIAEKPSLGFKNQWLTKKDSQQKTILYQNNTKQSLPTKS